MVLSFTLSWYWVPVCSVHSARLKKVLCLEMLDPVSCALVSFAW